LPPASTSRSGRLFSSIVVLLAPPDRQSELTGVGSSFAASSSEVGPFTWFEPVFGA
jgi:hypothetical protein